MQRRRFLAHLSQTLAALGLLPAASSAHPFPGATKRLHLQDCRIAGSQYYDCHAVLPQLRPGDPLQLRRQTGNPHDERAVAVLWRERKLGYLPRLDNAACASLLDRAHELHAEVIGIDDPDDEWEPVRLRVWADFGQVRT
ncbi:MAG: HIRAN domain-containing protein [Xanthomonadaceae bacterium]|nr:HIRAN domain-containing protein [Xanthomonadaceae bacterium]